MSAYVCSGNRVFSCIVELVKEVEEVKCPDLLAKKLYLLNVNSVEQRYELKEREPEEYCQYLDGVAEVKYVPQFLDEDADKAAYERISAAECWLYQSCEGDCMETLLYTHIRTIAHDARMRLAKKLFSRPFVDDRDADRALSSWAQENNIEKIWE